MKVLIVSCLFPPEPLVAASVSCDLAEELTSRGHDVTVLSPKPSRPLNYQFSERKEDYSFKHIIVDSFICPESKLWGRAMESYSFGLEIRNYIEKEHANIDVIYGVPWALFAAWFMARAAKKFEIPYCVHVHDVYPESYIEKSSSLVGIAIKTIFLPMDKYVTQNAKTVIAISPSEALYLSKSRNVDIANIAVVRNWQNDDRFIRAFKAIPAENHKLRFMYLGSINPTANVEYVIRSFAKIDSTICSLSVIGNGANKEKCESLAKEKKMVVEFGQVTPEKVPDKQAEADVLILSLREGVAKTATPSKLTAYLYSGRPVIACVDLDSDSADIIRNSNCGYVVPPGDEDALVDVIHRICKITPEELNKMGQAGADYAYRELSRKRNLDKLVEVIENHYCF